MLNFPTYFLLFLRKIPIKNISKALHFPTFPLEKVRIAEYIVLHHISLKTTRSIKLPTSTNQLKFPFHILFE